MGTLYVLEQDAYLSRDGGVLRVSRRAGREVLLERPLIHVREVVVLGNTVVTPSALYALLESGASVHYLTRGGRYFAHIAPLENKNAPLRLAQYVAHLDPEHKHALARSFVLGKLQNSIVYARRHGGDPAELERYLTLVQRCPDTESLRGLEGNAARVYFALLKPRFPLPFAFDGRSKRPPRDEVNSLLSLAYTFLAKEVQTALRVAGLDPYLGFLHEVKYGKPALALDLMEEFRPIVADSVVLTLLNKNMISLESFEHSRGHPQLNEEGFKQFLRAWEERLSHTVKHPLLKQNLAVNQILLAQARLLGKTFSGELLEYPPFTVR